jgi:hypothetical protein
LPPYLQLAISWRQEALSLASVQGGLRRTLTYRSAKAEKDAPVLKRMAELSALYPLLRDNLDEKSGNQGENG